MMTSLYWSVGVVHTIEWVCILCGHCIQNGWVEQHICVKFCIRLNHSSVETIQMIQKATAVGNWWLAASSWQYSCSCITSHAEFLAKYKITLVRQPTYSPYFDVFWLLAFSKSKIASEREEISDCQWDSGKYNRAADGDWENCVRSQGVYFEWDWGVIVLCTMFLLSCIFFNKRLYFSYYMAGCLLDTPCISDQ